MALHGAIKINGNILWTWSARRLSTYAGAENDYEVALVTPRGEVVKESVLTHTYDDGAVVLAAKVLAWAAADDSGKEEN